MAEHRICPIMSRVVRSNVFLRNRPRAQEGQIVEGAEYFLYEVRCQKDGCQMWVEDPISAEGAWCGLTSLE
jgi:hypothetical protein